MGINHDIPTASNQIHDFVGEYFARGDSSDVNRCSAATMCVRRRWYQARGVKGTPLDSRKIINFFLGQLTETTLQFFIEKGCVGHGKLYREVDFGAHSGTLFFQGKEVKTYSQKTFSYHIQEHKITGHADGIGERHDGTKELIEIKSASSYGYEEFKEKGPGDYIKQATSLMLTDELTSQNVRHVRFFFQNKQNGDVYDKLFEFDQKIADKVKEEYIQAQGQVAPPDPYGFVDELYRGRPTGRTTIPWQCQYCPYTETCKGKHTIEFKKVMGAQKPVYVFEKETQHV